MRATRDTALTIGIVHGFQTFHHPNRRGRRLEVQVSAPLAELRVCLIFCTYHHYPTPRAFPSLARQNYFQQVFSVLSELGVIIKTCHRSGRLSARAEINNSGVQRKQPTLCANKHGARGCLGPAGRITDSAAPEKKKERAESRGYTYMLAFDLPWCAGAYFCARANEGVVEPQSRACLSACGYWARPGLWLISKYYSAPRGWSLRSRHELFRPERVEVAFAQMPSAAVFVIAAGSLTKRPALFANNVGGCARLQKASAPAGESVFKDSESAVPSPIRPIVFCASSVHFVSLEWWLLQRRKSQKVYIQLISSTALVRQQRLP